jgi:hypothetical protein
MYKKIETQPSREKNLTAFEKDPQALQNDESFCAFLIILLMYSSNYVPY